MACHDLPDLFGYPQPCMVTVCGGAAPRGAPVRLWILLATQRPRLRRLSGGAAAPVLPPPLSAHLACRPTLGSYRLARRGSSRAAHVMAAIVAPTRTVTSSHRVVA